MLAKYFIISTLCPSYSPDINPVDYHCKFGLICRESELKTLLSYVREPGAYSFVLYS